jgi:hypothetical protein
MGHQQAAKHANGSRTGAARALAMSGCLIASNDETARLDLTLSKVETSNATPNGGRMGLQFIAESGNSPKIAANDVIRILNAAMRRPTNTSDFFSLGLAYTARTGASSSQLISRRRQKLRNDGGGWVLKDHG